MTKVGVTIAVPTFRRPRDLALLLPRLLEQASRLSTPSDQVYLIRVLVVDNDPLGSAAEVAAALAESGVAYVREDRAGIAAARNRAMDESAADRLLIMIDDDELPQPRWLEALLETWGTERAALVAGRVIAHYESDLDPWIAAGDFFTRRNLATGTEIAVSAGGNLLLDLDQVRRLGIRFDESLGLSGGEDTLFSRQLHAAGGRMVWCAESIICDRVPESRMSRGWVLRRARSHGNDDVRVDLMLASTAPHRMWLRARGLIGGLLRIGLGGGRFVAGMVMTSQRHQARGLRAAMRGTGMIRGAMGVPYEDYARPDGVSVDVTS